MRSVRGAALMISVSSWAFGQSSPPVRAFEVASVKPHDGPMYRLGVSTTGSRLSADAANILMLVMFAYNLKNYQVTGSAPLLKEDNTRWDIVAKSEGDGAPSRDEFRQMMKLLLADRFKLTTHSETREMPVYELVLAKNGPKFKESAPDADPTYRVGPRNGSRNYWLTMPKANMGGLIEMIEGTASLDRPVVDKTRLTGTYDIKLIYTPDTSSNRAESNADDISILAALQDQLGLKLEPQKAMIPILVIDHVEKPSGN